MTALALIRGGGDLASGVAIRLVRTGFKVYITEISQPLAVRRLVAAARVVFEEDSYIEEVHVKRARSIDEIKSILQSGSLPVIVDPQAETRFILKPEILIDGRMLKKPPELGIEAAPMVIGLGPGFSAGVNCHAVIETVRGPFLGRVYWQGEANPDTGLPEPVGSHLQDRVIRAPRAGRLRNHVEIGSILQVGQVIADVEGTSILAPFDGLLRGLLFDGLEVTENMKIGDLDPRLDRRLCCQVSDKALSVGGGVLEAILSRPDFRAKLAEGV